MTIKEWKNLEHGDIIRHEESAQSEIVHGHYERFVVVARVSIITNPQEWILVKRG